MVSPQFIALATAGAALFCLLRTVALRISPLYPAFIYLLLFQIASTAATFLTGLQSAAYEAVYIGMLIMEWVVYGLMMKEIYGAIFSDFPGIAVLGRWSVYSALGGTVLVGAAGVSANLASFAGKGSVLPFVLTAAHCFTFGFALLILIILVVISRYPIQLRKNVLVNAIFFGVLLLGEAAGLIADLLTLRRHTGWINLAISLNTILCFSVWPWMMSREGQTRVLRMRSGINSSEEVRLLGQLSSISALIMSTARK